jgi:glycosyltransferase 2 family protein
MRLSILTFLKISLTVVLLWILVRHSMLNMHLLLDIFYKPIMLSYVLALVMINISLNVWRWYRLNRMQGFPITFSDTFVAIYLGLAFNNLLPGSVSGDLVRINYLFKRIPQQKVAGLVSVLADRIIGLLGLLLAMCLLGLTYHSLFATSEFLTLFFSICLGISVMAVLAFILLMVLPNNLAIFQWLKRHKLIAELFAVISIYRKSPGILIECVITSIFTQIVILLIIAVIGYALNFRNISLPQYAVASMVTQVVNLIPIAPGGFGVGEAAFGKTLMLFNPEVVLPYATIFLGYRLLNMIICAPSLLFFFNKHQLAEANKN